MALGQPNPEIGQKMANGQLLFLALTCGMIENTHSYLVIVTLEAWLM